MHLSHCNTFFVHIHVTVSDSVGYSSVWNHMSVKLVNTSVYNAILGNRVMWRCRYGMFICLDTFKRDFYVCALWLPNKGIHVGLMS